MTSPSFFFLRKKGESRFAISKLLLQHDMTVLLQFTWIGSLLANFVFLFYLGWSCAGL